MLSKLAQNQIGRARGCAVACCAARRAYSGWFVPRIASPARTAQQHRPRPPALLSGTKRWATSTTPHSTASDPAEVEALQCLEQGTLKLEEGDVNAAKELYQRSVDIKRTASSLFNLGVTHYHLSTAVSPQLLPGTCAKLTFAEEFDEAIVAWKDSIALQPSSPDAHTNLASAYVMLPQSRPDLAIHHLNIAASLAPEDGEIAFNLAVVLESCGKLEEALEQYKRSRKLGIQRADMHIRNVGAKILGQMAKDGKSEP
ncbi:hypothetical protein BDY19DRAFT_971462 [Irpex rosettiformis]|uniref:Uncharacterized protein n=1 Tax=Irpex rosettiformis TaxID=378272 RepID=A0ACB8TR64_9APHY|nr:hypothetical protein BDY19DRAFT_971462 [Irpex rosettiformis]